MILKHYNKSYLLRSVSKLVLKWRAKASSACLPERFYFRVLLIGHLFGFLKHYLLMGSDFNTTFFDFEERLQYSKIKKKYLIRLFLTFFLLFRYFFACYSMVLAFHLSVGSVTGMYHFASFCRNVTAFIGLGIKVHTTCYNNTLIQSSFLNVCFHCVAIFFYLFEPSI